MSMNNIGPDEISRRKTLCDNEFKESDALVKRKGVNIITYKACIAYGDAVERKRLKDEIKEVWEDIQ